MFEQKQCIFSEEDIRRRSYQIWEREGRPEGKSEQNWLRAGAELKAECEADRIASIRFRKQPVPSDEEIAARAHLIWEHEGRPEAESDVYWLRAKAELEEEFCAECAAYVDGKSTTVVPPLLQISTPPSRTGSV